MAGASESTARARFVNANWEAGGESADGRLGQLVVTEVGERYELQPSAAAVATPVALTRASDALLWEPQRQTLVVANLVGTWLAPDWSGAVRAEPGR